jgi:hypothetical protein
MPLTVFSVFSSDRELSGWRLPYSLGNTSPLKENTMVTSILQKALFCLALGWGVAPVQGAEPQAQRAVARPEIASLVIALEDGRSYALSSRELMDAKGGALFWGDWAVTHLLVPQYASRPHSPLDAAGVLRQWFLVGASGELPAFLIHTSSGPVYPLDPGGPAKPWVFPTAPRPRVARITVGYQDGRVLALSEFTLRDPKSGVMVWTDYAVANLLIPFYRSAQNLPTSPEDVMRTWHKPGKAPGRQSLIGAEELPGYLVKPACIPSYPGADAIQ